MNCKQLFENWMTTKKSGLSLAPAKKVTNYNNNSTYIVKTKTYKVDKVEELWTIWQTARNWFLSYGSHPLDKLLASTPKLTKEIKLDFVKQCYYEFRCHETGKSLQKAKIFNAVKGGQEVLAIWLLVLNLILKGDMK